MFTSICVSLGSLPVLNGDGVRWTGKPGKLETPDVCSGVCSPGVSIWGDARFALEAELDSAVQGRVSSSCPDIRKRSLRQKDGHQDTLVGLKLERAGLMRKVDRAEESKLKRRPGALKAG
jgi:hypothetical protein